MISKFSSWIESNKLNLQDLGIISEKIIKSSNNLNPSITIHQTTDDCLGQISVWESGLVDMEVISISDGRKLLYEHQEISNEPNFDEILFGYIRIMTEEK
ncbi:hypothetical protein [Paenibacillus hamazuiensis]|uniref:immunity protein TriTu family protein n=1 Tax=Paenibacillus hamazuiensis TaxID=2936508 RepID=UPI00200FEDB7|nr:hypothetical protein [Paenibacillus hamazuiensis]